MEQIRYNMLYRWFVGLTIEEAVWDHSTFSANRDRLIENNVIGELFEEVVNLVREKKLLSDDHFSVEGTLIRAWVSQKSFRPKENNDDEPGNSHRNQDVNFRGEKRSNKTHASSTDNEALLAKKGSGLMNAEGKWSFSPAYALMYSGGINDYHTLDIEGKKNPRAPALLKIWLRYDLKKTKCKAILEEVKESVS